MYIPYNPNPMNKKTDDCAVRALTKALDKTWEEVYIDLCLKGLEMCDWGNNNAVIDDYLSGKGFTREIVPNTCPDCYTVNDFCNDHQNGTYVVGTGTHLMTTVDGNLFDSYDSGSLIPIYAYRKG